MKVYIACFAAFSLLGASLALADEPQAPPSPDEPHPPSQAPTPAAPPAAPGYDPNRPFPMTLNELQVIVKAAQDQQRSQDSIAQSQIIWSNIQKLIQTPAVAPPAK